MWARLAVSGKSSETLTGKFEILPLQSVPVEEIHLYVLLYGNTLRGKKSEIPPDGLMP